MTDRIKGFTVTLEKDIRVDDIQQTLNAIKMIKGVIHVEPSISTHHDNMAKERLKYELRDKFYDFMKENL